MTNKVPLVLIVEDEQVYAKILMLKFKEQGFEVSYVPNGQQALMAIKLRKPDVILLDLIMPVMDGFEVLTELQGDEETKDIKVVVFSSLGQPEDIQKAKSLGAHDYLVKSEITFQDAVEEIKKIMQRAVEVVETTDAVAA